MQQLDQSQLPAEFIDCPIQMERAIELAAMVLSTRPNPRVGCVLVKNGQIIAEGWHTAAGQPHAEAMALVHAGADAAGSTAIVTLEPCAHLGRTGPCTDALITAGVSKVVIASVDPNPQVAGQGIKQLEDAGIAVYHLAQYEQAARALNPGYFKRREQGLPFVTLKLAMSLDGRTALANGQSKWITGGQARSDVQKLRAASSAILTGINTILVDDPSLTVRPDELGLSGSALDANAHLSQQPPLRVIVDSQMRTPGTAKLFSQPGEVQIFTTRESEQLAVLADKATLKHAPGDDGMVNLRSVLESLAIESECNEVLVEAGPRLSGALLEAGLIDQLVLYIAPKILGADARPLFGVSGLQSLEESWGFTMVKQQMLGPDCKLTLVPR